MIFGQLIDYYASVDKPPQFLWGFKGWWFGPKVHLRQTLIFKTKRVTQNGNPVFPIVLPPMCKGTAPEASAHYCSFLAGGCVHHWRLQCIFGKSPTKRCICGEGFRHQSNKHQGPGRIAYKRLFCSTNGRNSLLKKRTRLCRWRTNCIMLIHLVKQCLIESEIVQHLAIA